MTFNQINYFLELARSLNYTNAAASLFITQSTLSRSIAALENELGVQLFERDYHNVTLTEAGEVMFAEMRANMDRIAKTIVKVQETANRPNERIRVGILEGQGIDACVLFAIKDMAEFHPNMAIEIKKSDYYDMMAELDSGKLDFVLTVMTRDAEKEEAFSYLRLRDLEQYFIASATDPIWEHKVTMETIAHRTLIMPSKFYPGNQEIIECLKNYVDMPSVIHAEDMETHRVFLETGMGVTILNSCSVIYGSRADAPIRTLKISDNADMVQLELNLLWKKEIATSFMETFIERVEAARNGLKQHPIPQRE